MSLSKIDIAVKKIEKSMKNFFINIISFSSAFLCFNVLKKKHFPAKESFLSFSLIYLFYYFFVLLSFFLSLFLFIILCGFTNNFTIKVL
jgi:hypothetical protein